MALVRRPTPSPIEYLVERRFPGHQLLDIPPAIGRRFASGMSANERHRKLDAVKAYRKELLAKPVEEIQALFERECALAQQEALALADREEQARPFNVSSAKADFAHWSKAAYWTLDEALALVFGRAPEVVTWKLVEPYTRVSRFAKEFARARDLVIRAKNWKQLYEPALPGFFLAWATRADLPVPEELVGELEARGVVVEDWKDSYDKLKVAFDELKADRDKIALICKQLIDDRKTHKDRVAQLEEEAESWQFDEEDTSYPFELDVAMQAWRAVSNQRDTALSAKQQLAAWLSKHYSKLSAEARERISTLCNWEKRGGRRPTDR